MARVHGLELGVDRGGDLARDPIQPDQGRVADRPQDVVEGVPGHLDRRDYPHSLGSGSSRPGFESALPLHRPMGPSGARRQVVQILYWRN
ncbi:MAG: hypothetical protein ACREA0_31945, partial [bacterium]